MKLKTIFILFNAIVAVTFLVVFLMPLLFLGIEFSMIFWRSNWYLAILFALVLLVLNVYFGLNWELYAALEREDWREIAEILEKRIRKGHRFSESNIRLLINACVVSGKTEKTFELEEFLREKKPGVLERHALRFGIPYLLTNDGARIERFFSEFRRPAVVGGRETDREQEEERVRRFDHEQEEERARGFHRDHREHREGQKTGRGGRLARWWGRRYGSSEDAYWIEWGYAFGLLLQERVDEGRAVLREIVQSAPAGLVRAVSLYLLSPNKGSERDATSETERWRRELAREMPREVWTKQVERERSELHMLVLSKLLRDVEEWLYKPGEDNQVNIDV